MTRCKENNVVRIGYPAFVLIMLLLNSGCSVAMSGTVVDGETGRPIEGAVVLVEWTSTKGLGLTHTELYKVVETVTDKEGRFKVSGVSNPLVDPPRITIYKRNYVAWNNEYIFPGYNRRADFKSAENEHVKLEPFKKEYSRSDHVFFLHSVTHWGKLINEAYRWEELEEERQK